MGWRFVIAVILLLSVVGPSRAKMYGYVDGHDVYYSPNSIYTVSPEFVYIGSYVSSYGNNGLDSFRYAEHKVNHEVFGKTYNGTRELVEIFIARWDKLPDRWRYSPQGQLEQRTYPFRVEKFTGLADFLKKNEYTFSAKFFGGMLLGYNQENTSTEYFYAIATTIIPQEVESKKYILDRFYKNVTLRME